MKISLIQMNSQENKAANLDQARRLIDEAVETDRPDMAVLPEMFSYLGIDGDRDGRWAAAEVLPGGPTYSLLQDLARRHRLHIHGGSMLEKDGDALYNTTVAFGPDGAELARYRKIHLFDVTTPDGKEYRESATFSRGREVVAYDALGARIGCSICYDLRFPELYQALARKDVQIVMVPAAFTAATGKDHWEILLRARAIETECFVVAPGQCGTFAGGKRATYGHSMAVDPWGQVIARAGDGVGFVTARLDLDYVTTVRGRIPVAQHKVL